MRQLRSVVILLAVVASIAFSPAAVATEEPPEAIPEDAERATVRAVVDGDTIRITLEDGTKTTVRLIGADTPETKDPDEPVACYGPEASAQTAKLLTRGRVIWLEQDVSDTDRYDRLLRYVWVVKDRGGVYLLDEVLIRDGFAVAIVEPPDTAHAERLTRAQAAAQEADRGLWSACPELAASLLPTPTPLPTTVPVPTEAPVAVAAQCDPSYPDVCIPPYPPDLNCPDVPYGRFRVVGADPHGFDRDYDGIGCESN